MKNVTNICQYIAKHERGKQEVSIAQIREIVGIISDLLFNVKTAGRVLILLQRNGERRFKRRMRRGV